MSDLTREKVYSQARPLVLSLIHGIGSLILNWLHEIGEFFVFLWNAIRALFGRPFRTRLIFEQMDFVGVNSILIIFLTGCFTGMVLGLQSGRAFRLFNTEGLTGVATGLSLARELGPVMAALMVTARAGSSMAAQIGTMRVTQQIDALMSMAVNPLSYLIAPRIIASVLMLPLLTGFFDLVGIVGAYFVSIGLLKMNEAVFVEKIVLYMKYTDITQGLIKAAFFGLILAWVGCYKGYHAKDGAEGVGKATTSAVVVASVLILVTDYFLTALLF